MKTSLTNFYIVYLCSKRGKTKGNQVRNFKFIETQGKLISYNFY